MRRAFVPILLALCVAFPAAAATWQRRCLAGAENTVDGVYLNWSVCSVPTSATDDLEILDVERCSDFDVGLSVDANGDGTGATALTWQLQWCPVPQSDAVVNTDAERDASCVDIGEPVTGEGNLHGSGRFSSWIRVNLGGTFAGDPVFFLSCN